MVEINAEVTYQWKKNLKDGGRWNKQSWILQITGSIKELKYIALVKAIKRSCVNQVQLDLEEGAFIILYTVACVMDVSLRLYKERSAEKQVNHFINVL